MKSDGSSIKHHFEILSVTPMNIFTRLYSHYCRGKTVYDFHESAEVDMELHGKKLATGWTLIDKYPEMFDRNIKHIDTLAQICSKNDIMMLFVTTPVYHTFRKNMSDAQHNKKVEAMNDLARKYDNVKYLNWIDDPDFTVEDYKDSDHLNYNGASKFSVKLANYVDSLGIIW